MSTVTETQSIDEPQIIDPLEESSNGSTEEEIEEEKVEEQSSTEEETESNAEEEACQTFKAIPDSEMYVLVINGIPKYFVKTAEEADLCMWDAARRLCKIDPDYTTRYVKVGKNALNIERQCNWYVMSYAETIHRLRYHRVQEVERITVEEKVEKVE